MIYTHSSLGKAFQYLLTHWQTLTRFLEVPGAPLENNTAERALKLAIRQRKNSLFYATDYSAYIASMLTQPDRHLSSGRSECPGVLGRVAGAPSSGVSGPISLGAVELPHAPGPAFAPLAPILGHRGLLGIAIPEHDSQLACRQTGGGVLGGGPPSEAPLREALRA